MTASSMATLSVRKHTGKLSQASNVETEDILNPAAYAIMSGANTTGPGWSADLVFSPKKRRAYEDKLGAESPARFDHRINDVLPKKPPQTREIADSDSDALDDDDDDDLELPSLNAMYGIREPTGKKPLRIRSGHSSVEATPEKKLADFMAIIRDTEEVNELDRMQEASAIDLNSSPSRNRSDKPEARALYKHAVNIAQGETDAVDSDTEQHYTRVRQAMERQAAEHMAPCYYFFAPPTETLSAPGTPARATPGPTTAPRTAHLFDLSIQSKLATKYSGKPGIALPDELLVWILDVFPAEESEAVRAEYLQILTGRSTQVGKLIDEERLKQWFLRIGADERAISHGEQANTVTVRGAPTTSRDWRPFHNIMELLRRCCSWMAINPLIHAAVFLLRASMDSEVRLRANLATVLNDTLATLAANNPDAEREKFCRKVCNLFVQTVDSVNLLARAVEATHHVGPRLLDTDPGHRDLEPFKDLRTRLQLSVFFKDAEKASPERCGTARALLQSILQRLDEPDFKGRVGGSGGGGGSRGVANYYDLEGYGLALTGIIPFLHQLRQNVVVAADAAEASEFSRGIDDLRRKVSFVTSTMQIVGSMEDLDARYEAKTRWKAVDHWIAHFFPKKGGRGVFSDEITAEEAEAQSRRVERQARMMTKFFRKEPAGNA